MSVIKTILNKVWFLAYWTGLIILTFIIIGMLIAFVHNPYWLSIDSCQDNGKVWDYEENRCREDCYSWKKEYGCIKLNDNQAARLKRCNGRIQDCDKESLYREVCSDNNKAWNIDSKTCLFEFKPQDCFRLQGNWEYPDICKRR